MELRIGPTVYTAIVWRIAGAAGFCERLRADGRTTAALDALDLACPAVGFWSSVEEITDPVAHRAAGAG